MGNCFKKIPDQLNLENETESTCCNNDDFECPSTCFSRCCFITIIKSKSKTKLDSK